jgi:diacylglycerol kinase
VFSSIWCALKGLAYLFSHEKNMRIHLVATVLVVIVAWYAKVTYVQMALLFIACGIVLITEAINTVIELTWNKLEPDHHPLVGIIKDVMAGATLIAALTAVLVGVLVFLSYSAII